MAKKNVNKKEQKERTEIPIICPYCGVGCNIELIAEEGKAIKTVVRGRNEDHNGKFVCIKGLATHEFISSPERLTKPLIRKKGELIETDWETALTTAGRLLKKVQNEYGPSSIGTLISCKIANEEVYLAQKIARTIFGTNNIDTCARLCHAPSVVGLRKMFGFGAVSACLDDFKETDVVILVGANTRVAHPVVWNMIRKRKKKTFLIVADPFPVRSNPDLKISPKPRSDIYWINAVARIILELGMFDVNFISKRSIGFENYQKSLKPYSQKLVEEKTGVAYRDLERIAFEIAGKKVLFVWGMGLTQHAHGTEAVMSLGNLALLTGNVGRKGAGLVPLRGQNNVQGAGDLGASPNTLPGSFGLEEPGVVPHFKGIWNTEIPTTPGLSATEMIHHIADGKIKALYVIGENPVLSEPQANFVKWMLQSPEMEALIVQEVFLTETAKLAHVIFPACTVGEKEGLYTNADRRIQYSAGGLTPPGMNLPDWKITQLLANKLGANWNYLSSEEIWEEIRRVAPIFTGVSYGRLKNGSGLYWPVYDPEDEGTRRLYMDRFMFRDGRARFYGIQPPRFNNLTSESFPFLMVTHRLFEHFNTGEMSRRSKMLMRTNSEGYVVMNHEDYKTLGLSEEEPWIRLTSPFGTLATKARLLGGVDVPRGYLFAPIHFFNTDNFNVLTSTYPLDPLSRMPSLKTVAVRLKKEAAPNK